ncbi:MAG: AAA family ATPase [Candidatus Hodarchaeota archaeon]
MLIEKDRNANLRDAVWSIINLTQANQLFIHSSQLEIQYKEPKKTRVSKKLVPEILTMCVLNALVPNSAMLLIGGHGGAKTSLTKLLGRMFTGKSLDEIEDSILRGHPQLTEEKILATLNLPKLMQGEEVVKWRNFVTSFWKIVDEVNRMTPYAQNILLSLLAERRVKFYDATYTIPQYCLYATMNPQDAGTFNLPTPFLDRFGISLPFSMPLTHDLSLILKSKDTKLYGYDEFIQVPKVLLIEDMIRIWRLVDTHEVSDEAEQFIQAIIREFSLCARINKGAMNDKKIGPDLCNKCHFDTPKSVCNKVTTILSVRAAKDLYRYSKALAWLLNIPVDLYVVMTIAPYVIQHRVNFVGSELNQSPFFGDKIAFTRHLLEIVKDRFNQRKEMLDIMENIKKGKSDAVDLKNLEEYGKHDLIVGLDFLPVAHHFLDKKYKGYLEQIEKAYDGKDITALLEMKKELLNDSELMNKGELLTKIGIYLHKLTFKNYRTTFNKWRDQIWADLSSEFGYLDKELRKSLVGSYQKQLRTNDSLILLIVTGIEDNSMVSLDVSGGTDALKIKEILHRASVFHESE